VNKGTNLHGLITQQPVTSVCPKSIISLPVSLYTVFQKKVHPSAFRNN